MFSQREPVVGEVSSIFFAIDRQFGRKRRIGKCRANAIRLRVETYADILGFMADVTQILNQIERGDPAATEQLLPLVYDELRKLAAAKLVQEKPGQTLQATALVHEAYIRLVDVSASNVGTHADTSLPLPPRRCGDCWWSSIDASNESSTVASCSGSRWPRSWRIGPRTIWRRWMKP